MRTSPSVALGLRMLRVHQWAKNVLLFVPVLAARHITDMTAMSRAALGFLAFSLLASAVYIVNDINDVARDRAHPTKRQRPFASGALPLRVGYISAPVLVVTALALAAVLGRGFVMWLLVYLVITTAYTFSLKRMVLVDAITLATLYTVRVFAGGQASGIPLTYWLVSFSVFLFLSLAFVKRYAELVGAEDEVLPSGRGYRASDAPLIQILGIAAGFSAALVLAMYIKSTEALQHYNEPEILWATLPVSVSWISWIWLKASRREMHDDPVIFALRDRASWVALVAFVGVLAVATVGLVP